MDDDKVYNSLHKCIVFAGYEFLYCETLILHHNSHFVKLEICAEGHDMAFWIALSSLKKDCRSFDFTASIISFFQ